MTRWAISDLHGYYDIYEKVKKILKPDDHIYFLGDAGDRGPEGWKLIKAILADKQWEYIKGNHDDMLIKTFYEQTSDVFCTGRWSYLHACNGGAKTLDDALSDESPEVWINKLRHCPTLVTLKNDKGIEIILSHAGLTPCLNGPELEITDFDLMWDRNHLYFENERENSLVIHGHSPCDYIIDDLGLAVPDKPGALAYTKGKLCIDNAVYRTGAAILYNIDTEESIIINTDMEVIKR